MFLGETRVELSDPTITTLIARWEPAGGDLLSGYELLYKRVPDKSGIGVTPGEVTPTTIHISNHDQSCPNLLTLNEKIGLATTSFYYFTNCHCFPVYLVISCKPELNNWMHNYQKELIDF